MSFISYSHTETIVRTVTLPNGQRATQAVGSQDVANNGGIIAMRYYSAPIILDIAKR